MSGHKFRRQQRIGHYIVDFACMEKKLVIEIDGGQHADGTQYDVQRNFWLESVGYRVMRFWNNEVLIDADTVRQVIWNALTASTPHPHLPPQGGKESIEDPTQGGKEFISEPTLRGERAVKLLLLALFNISFALSTVHCPLFAASVQSGSAFLSMDTAARPAALAGA